MAFLKYDLYLASGTAQLINNWVDPVYKFDSSSFYNWEQDNLPIYDLEDRDDFLHEMAGYPTSAVDGIMLTVSDCGIDNKKVFGTLSSVVDALPNTIRFPIIVEVATSGPLGGLHLENIDFEGSTAGLEIINRGFAKAICGSSTSPSSNVATAYGALSEGSSIETFLSIDLSTTMTESSSLGVSDTVWQSNANGASLWWNYYTRAFVQTPEWSKAAAASPRTVTISSRFLDVVNATPFLSPTANTFTVNDYADNSASSDVVVTNLADDSLVVRQDIQSAATARAPALVYANDLSGVSVKDCTGRIYIRGFCVDGGNQADLTTGSPSQRTNVGFDIQNSDVVIENCTAARCKNAGLQAVNSNVILNRGFIAFHNYELQNGGATLSEKVTSNPTAGLRAINSNITLSASTNMLKGLPIDSPFSFYRNMIGIELENSQLVTPPNCKGGTSNATNLAGVITDNTYGAQTIVLQTFFNVTCGIKAKNSLIETGYRVASFQNTVGMKLENSTYKVAQSSVDHNQEYGILANGSIVNYNKNGDLIGYDSAGGPFYPVNEFTNNGQHVLLNSSEFIPTYAASAMSTNYEILQFSGNHGIEQRSEGDKQTLPGVVVDNGSYMNSVATQAILLTANGDAGTYLTDGAIKGAAFRVTNGSHLELQGHGTKATLVVGPELWSKQQKIAALYAGNNSHIYVAGPTTICQAGVDALAEDNSKISFGPHLKDGIIDASGWALATAANQTQVRLHATRACLVANRNSTISMKDMGDYHARWNSKYLTNPDYPTGNESDGYNTSAYCSSGYLQFYPNPYLDYSVYTGLLPQAKYPTNIANVTDTLPLTPLPWNWTDTGVGVSSLSWGGFCVRAVGGSHVEAQNVWFPTGWTNTSGPVYNASGPGCDHLRIWNIADNSELHASYLSVGSDQGPVGASVHPQDASAAYYGPSAMWCSGTTPDILFGAPSSTPNTSSLSILDSFGLGANPGAAYGYVGKTDPENMGPFRIYVSPHPKAKFLGFPRNGAGWYFNPEQSIGSHPRCSMGYDFNGKFPESELITGAPYQLFSQGYAASSDCSALNYSGVYPELWQNPSSIYEDLGFSGYVQSLPNDWDRAHYDGSSFFYTSAMLPYDTENRIWLDESAMNTFANAKNGTLNTSGRKKIVGYYRATTDYPGEADATTDQGLGIGSVNLFDLDRDL